MEEVNYGELQMGDKKYILKFDEFEESIVMIGREENEWIQVSFYFVILRKEISKHCRVVEWTVESDKLVSRSHMSESDMQDTIHELLLCNYMRGVDFVYGIYDGLEFSVFENDWLEFQQKEDGIYARYKEESEK